MKFIHMSGKALAVLISDDELRADDLQAAGVGDDSVVRVNQQGDIEVRRSTQWDVIGGLLGAFEDRIKDQTGMDWV